MNEEYIIQRILGAKKHHPPETRYIRRMNRIRKNDQYVLSIPLWQDGKRKTQYIGTFSSLEEAQQAREFTFEKIKELANISFSPPSSEIHDSPKT